LSAARHAVLDIIYLLGGAIVFVVFALYVRGLRRI
jgi:hypothetical protein